VTRYAGRALDAAIDDPRDPYLAIERRFAPATPLGKIEGGPRLAPVYVCAGACGEPIVWLNGEPYSAGEIEEFGSRCEACGDPMHSACGIRSDYAFDPDALLCADCSRGYCSVPSR
jgi:hypothetical protein